MREKANPNRRRDIAAALKRAKPGDHLTLQDIALVWGVTKQRFVTVRNQMADFPDPLPGQGNVYIYPAKQALEAMLAHETRHDDAARARQKRTALILGHVARGRAAEDIGAYTPNDLSTLARLAADTEQRERDQGLYVPVAEVAALAGEIFGEISEFMGGLANMVDPHGLLPPSTRAQIDSGGSEALLGLHRRMKDMLSPDAKPRGNRTASVRTRRAQARR